MVSAANGEPIVFSRDVLPILSANCFFCHGPDPTSREADLRLDERESPIDFGAIVPGEPEASELILRVNSTDESEMMPPPESHKTLKPEQKEILAKWIASGAKYERHWSFEVPKRPATPVTDKKNWNANPIDAFVLARLSAESLEPSEEAKRATLIRRVSFDLTGLPPTADEVSDFVNNKDPKAYEALVDRLLASPHFGEQMSQSWLDAARFADTNGYSIDGGRQMWIWRDWVINAFNKNKPYDQFLVEQIAGDLLPDATQEQLIATGFQRNNMVTHEGGTIPAENLVNYNADRVKTLGEAVLGMTLGCAQCHDHKFDPIKQRDYYSVFAFFNTISDVGLDGDGGKSPRPSIRARTVLKSGDPAQIQQEMAALQKQLDHPRAEDVAAWESEQIAALKCRGEGLVLHPAEVLSITTPNSGDGFEVDGETAYLTKSRRFAAYDVLFKIPPTTAPITGYRVVFLRDSENKKAGLGFGKLRDVKNKTFILTAVSLSADSIPGKQVNVNQLRQISRVTASSWLERFRAENVLHMRRGDGWSPDANRDNEPHVTVTLAEPLSAAENSYATMQLNFGYGKSLVASRFKFFAVSGEDDGTTLPDEIVEILNTQRVDRNEQQTAKLEKYYSAHSDTAAPLRVELANLRQRLSTQTDVFTTMVMKESGRPRETHILNRGNYAQPLEKVTPGVPEALAPFPKDAPANRLGLAQWIVMPENSLTARVAVNRLWQQFFGTGLVATAADFGTQGAWPSHPKLLDWLAVEFRESGWDVKAMVRLIVMSATYRQSSATSEALLARDPQNRMLARGPRFRLSAEGVRDNALKVSGLLVDWIGGPSVNPYSPGDLWREVSHYGSTPATSQTFVQDHGSKLYRRSLYTYWKRTIPPPNMMAFDSPNREVCTVSRSATTTPLQALVLLNDVQFVEAARAFAERIIKSSTNDKDCLDWAYLECLARSPAGKEAQVVLNLLARERTRYTADTAAARLYLSNGESPRDTSISLSEHAAWTQVAAILLNLSETVTRN